MKRIASWIGIFGILFLNSCTRFTQWTYHNFHAPEKMEWDLGLASGHLRRVRSYYQLNTVALFDVLWLSDEVRRTYVDLYSQKYCLSPLELEQEYAHELGKNNQTITFYVMMPESDGIEFDNKLGKWAITLDIDGVCYDPISVKIIDDLAYEWRKILGDSYNGFKTPYKVVFSANSIEGIPLINSSLEGFSLIFASIDYKEYCYFTLSSEDYRPHHVHMD